MDKSERAIKEIKAVRKADERADQEEEMDKWFKNLNQMQMCFMIMRFWEDASYKEKEQIYKNYKYK